MILLYAVSSEQIVLKFMVLFNYIFFSNFVWSLLFFWSNCSLFSSLRGPIQLLVIQNLDFLYNVITDALFVGKYAFSSMFCDCSIFVFFLFYLFCVTTEPNYFQRKPQ